MTQEEFVQKYNELCEQSGYHIKPQLRPRQLGEEVLQVEAGLIIEKIPNWKPPEGNK